jgi:hypothetical protein
MQPSALIYLSILHTKRKKREDEGDSRWLCGLEYYTADWEVGGSNLSATSMFSFGRDE